MLEQDEWCRHIGRHRDYHVKFPSSQIFWRPLFPPSVHGTVACAEPVSSSAADHNGLHVGITKWCYFCQCDDAAHDKPDARKFERSSDE